MKLKPEFLITFLLLLFSSCMVSSKVGVQQPYVSIQVFYDELSPYGEWVNYPNYGYVWLPDAGPDFVPYSSNGRWIYTDYGWTWLSNYEWGWAPFHYGRWNFDNYYGWFWVPDTEWGPAWVSWRSADGYYGWEPLAPGISLSMSFRRNYDSRNDHWIFVRDRDIDRADINNYYIGRNDQDRILSRSSMINNTYIDRSRNSTYIAGPGRNDFQRVTGRRVNRVTVQENNRPGQNFSNDRVSIYRPEIRKNGENGRRAEPSRISNLNEVRQPSERSVRSQPANTKNPATYQERQSNQVNQQRNTNNDRTSQPQNVRRDQQQINVNQENAKPPQNIKREQEQNVKQQNENPAQNSRREVQQNNLNQQSNPPQNTRQEVQQNNVQKQSNPPQATRREIRQNARKDNQSNSSRSTGNSRREQNKKNETSDEKIKN